MNLGKIAVVAAGVALGVAACGSTSTSPASSSSSSSSVTPGAPLYEEANVGVTFTQDFNPYDTASLAHGMNMTTLVYEPLYEMDALNPATSGMHPWLASSYQFADGGLELAITVKSNVKFDDGSAMTANDVANTFALLKAFPDADYSGVPTQSAAPSVAGQVVTLTFKTPQYTNLWAILGSTYITQASAFPIGTDPSKGTVANPVGTGPFMLDSFSTQAVKFKPNPDYWGGKPPESEVVVPNESNNNAATEALDSNTLDWAGNEIPSVVANYIDLNPNTNHVWYASGNTVTLNFNLMTGNGGATGIGDVAVRSAVSLGIDRTVLSSIGESGYEAAALSAGGLNPAQLAAYPNTTYTNDLPVDAAATPTSVPSWTGATVQSTLEADGYAAPANWGTATEANCDGTVVANCWNKGGAIIKFSIWDPESFSDYWADAQEISGQLQSEGMDVTTDNASGGYTQWQDAMNNGQFQTALHWGAGGNIPFVQLDNWLDYAANCTGTPVVCASGDYGQFNSSAAQTALTAYEGADPTTPTGQSAISSAIATLEGIMATQVPDAPVLYGADWNVYSTAHYTGWPSASNPYMDPSPDDPELPYILMQLKPVAS
jgi:peptide/nickel transport system substrate-binding protein